MANGSRGSRGNIPQLQHECHAQKKLHTFVRERDDEVIRVRQGSESLQQARDGRDHTRDNLVVKVEALLH